MASYVVMEPPADRAPRDERIVRDGFHWLGFLLPFFWLIWHRLWIEAAVVVAIVLCLSLLTAQEGWAVAATALSLAVSFFVGLEGAALRLAALRRRGWREWGVVEAESVADAETRYLAEKTAPAAEAGRPRAIVAAAPGPVQDGGPALGLLGYSHRT